MTPARWAGVVLGALLLLAGAFSAGRFTAPLRTDTRIEYRDLTVEDITRGFTFAKTVNRVVYRNVVTTITDAGTVTADTSIEREGSAMTAAGNDTAHMVSETKEISEKTVTNRPDWRVGAQVGASMQPPALPITGPLVVGVSVERRIVGGVSAGIWANTAGAGGASLSVEF